jgi:hypothetical protein
MTMHRGSELMVIDFDDEADVARRCAARTAIYEYTP